MTVDFAKEYLLDDCADCPENENGECMTQSHCFEVKRMAIEALEQTRWIPVSERLPEMHEVLGILKKLVYMRSDEVIVTIRDNKNGSVVTHSKCYLWEGKWHGDIFDWLKASKVDYEVIAWMPLPQPMKVGETDE